MTLERPTRTEQRLFNAVLADPEGDGPRLAYNDPTIQEYVKWIDKVRTEPTVHSRSRPWHGHAHHRSALDLLDNDGFIEVRVLESPSMEHRLAIRRGFVEDIGVLADHFHDIAEELYSLAPIRMLRIANVEEGIDSFASSPHLARIRALDLVSPWEPWHATSRISDEAILRLIESPYLKQLAYLRIGHQPHLRSETLQHIVTSKNLPLLSMLVVDENPLTHWVEPVSIGVREVVMKDGHFEYVPNSSPPPTKFDGVELGRYKDIRDTPRQLVLHPPDWIVELEAALGYVPCVHPEVHYGSYVADREVAVIAPIAKDPEVMKLRGRPVHYGKKPSLLEHKNENRCLLCGYSVRDVNNVFTDMYGSEDGGPVWDLICRRCGWTVRVYEPPPGVR